MENLPENPFGLSKMKQNLKKTDHNHKILGVYLGLAVIVLFLGLVSLAPQVSKRFGNLAEKKESQISKATGLASPCTSSSGGYGDADGDGDVDVIDQVHINRYASGQSTSIAFTADVIKRADVDGNLRVDMVDLLKVSRYVGQLDLTFPMCIDQDEDGYVNGVENYIGTNPYKACATSSSDVDATKPGKPSKVWPADLFTATGVPATYNKITIQDLTTFLAPTRRLESSPGDAGYDKRWDLVPGAGIFGKDINISDLTNLNTVAPPMFGGTQRAMNGPACVSKPRPTVNLSVNSTSLTSGSTLEISWTSANAVFPCSASGDWSGQKQLNSGTNPYRVSLSAGTFNYTLTCYGPGGETPDTETVTVTVPSACPSIIVPRNLYRNSAGTIFVITDDCQKRGIVSPDAFNSCLYDWNAVVQATDANLNSVSSGANLTGPPCPEAPTVTLPPPVVNEPRGWPVSGTIGDLGIHYSGTYPDAAAVDILVEGGTPIFSTMSGVATVLPWDSACGYGLDITSSSGFLTHFCHLHNNLSGSDIIVRSGDNVTQGNHIGYIGFSNEMGNASTPQTHYAIQEPTSAPGAIPGEMRQDYVPQEPYAGLQVTR